MNCTKISGAPKYNRLLTQSLGILYLNTYGHYKQYDTKPKNLWTAKEFLAILAL